MFTFSKKLPLAPGIYFKLDINVISCYPFFWHRCQILSDIRSNWHQIRQIWDILVQDQLPYISARRSSKVPDMFLLGVDLAIIDPKSEKPDENFL